jgi:hypothetical protein
MGKSKRTWLVKIIGLIVSPFDALDSLDHLIFALLGLVVAIALLLGPPFLAYKWFLKGNYVPASISGLLWAVGLVGIVGDLRKPKRKRKLGWITTLVLATWLVLTFALIWFTMTA